MDTTENTRVQPFEMLGPAVNRQPGSAGGLVEQSNAAKNNPAVGWLADCVLLLAAAGLLKLLLTRWLQRLAVYVSGRPSALLIGWYLPVCELAALADCLLRAGRRCNLAG